VAISNLIRLLELPDDALDMIAAGRLTEGHGRALLQAPGPQVQRRLAREARDRGLSVRETEALARSAVDPGARLRPAPAGDRAAKADAEAARSAAEDALGAALGVEVKVRFKRRGCTVEIALDDISEAHELARRLRVRPAA
jgi:ParB family chromosome partitioning protein